MALRLISCLVGIAVLLTAAPAWATIPSIGGNPTFVDDALFSTPSEPPGLAWEIQVFSYSFEGTNGVDAPDPTMAEPDPGQTLFVYAVQMTTDVANFSASVDQFVVGNPLVVNVGAVGYSTTIVPTGFVGPRQNPSFAFASEEAQSVLYAFSGASSLDPDEDAPEFSVVWFLADGPTGIVQGSVQGGAATTDIEQILGPVPEPSGLVLLGLGALALVGRRR